jgi:hypothetical protein
LQAIPGVTAAFGHRHRMNRSRPGFVISDISAFGRTVFVCAVVVR